MTTYNLEAAKLAQLDAVNMNFNNQLEFNVTFENRTYQANTESYQQMIFYFLANLPEDFYWVDINNNKIPMTKEKLQQLITLIQTKRFELFNLHQLNKDKIRSATQLTELFN